MRITLNRANKLAKRLKDVCPDIPQYSFGTITGTLESLALVDSAVHNAIISRDRELGRFGDFISVKTDLANLKEALFRGNIESGVSQRLNQINLSRQLLALYQSAERNVESTSVQHLVTKEEILEYVGAFGTMGGIQTSRQFTLPLFTEDYLKSNIKELRGLIDTLEDEVADINASYKIDVELSLTSRELLGLDPR